VSSTSTSTSTTTLDRRTMLRAGAAVVAGAGAAGAMAPAASAATGAAAGELNVPPLRLRKRLALVDGQRRQRFLLSSTKPPLHLNGKTYPAEARQGPADASYLIFNDENQSEKGGIIASSRSAQISFDYPNVQGLTMSTRFAGKLGAARLSMQEMPDPDIPIEELRPEDVPQRVLLGCSNAGDGALLILCDHQGRPRITLHVDGDDVPRIRILDADGDVVAAAARGARWAGERGGARPGAVLPAGPRRAGPAAVTAPARARLQARGY
jgi:hypothetical protein